LRTIFVRLSGWTHSTPNASISWSIFVRCPAYVSADVIIECDRGGLDGMLVPWGGGIVFESTRRAGKNAYSLYLRSDDLSIWSYLSKAPSLVHIACLGRRVLSALSSTPTTLLTLLSPTHTPDGRYSITCATDNYISDRSPPSPFILLVRPNHPSTSHNSIQGQRIYQSTNKDDIELPMARRNALNFPSATSGVPDGVDGTSSTGYSCAFR